MARIAGINIPPQQHAEIGLTAIYGIGRSRSRLILEQCGIPCTKKVQDLTDAELERIRDAVSKFTVEGDLRREVQLSIKRLIDLGTYRGMRHRRGLLCLQPCNHKAKMVHTDLIFFLLLTGSLMLPV